MSDRNKMTDRKVASKIGIVALDLAALRKHASELEIELLATRRELALKARSHANALAELRMTRQYVREARAKIEHNQDEIDALRMQTGATSHE